ncbi:MAG: cation:proton antiporter [Betaproteobacteria bacterium]|nr:cation:proton antiporter [Betaproteobacteria bacterium]
MISAIGFLVVGGLMLAMGLLSPFMRRLPLTMAIVYLAVGMIVGPTVLGLFHFNPLKESAVLEVLTEAAVLVSLFAAGVKLPAPVTWARWRSPVLLAFVSIAITVILVAAFGYYLLELPLGAALLLGAILAPTDPVLAGDVQVRHAEDRDRLRFNLTCEAGMNDGSAFPFVMLGLGLLGLHELGALGLRWVLVDVLWATAGGIALGVAGGVAIAHLAARLRRADPDSERYDDMIGLGMIGAVYGLAVLAQTWGFLAVFFAAVALRQTELGLAGAPAPEPTAGDDAPPIAQVSVDSLVFKEHLERLSEILLVLLIGGTLFLDSWSWRAVSLALFVFVVARPLSVLAGLSGTRTPWPMRGMIGWFGVRGIGSLYYLMYAIEHGLPEPLALELIHLTLIVVTLSIVMHGLSVKPLMLGYWHGRKTA